MDPVQNQCLLLVLLLALSTNAGVLAADAQRCQPLVTHLANVRRTFQSDLEGPTPHIGQASEGAQSQEQRHAVIERSNNVSGGESGDWTREKPWDAQISRFCGIRWKGAACKARVYVLIL